MAALKPTKGKKAMPVAGVLRIPAIPAVNLSDLLHLDVHVLQQAYSSAKPYPHIVLDDIFSPEVLYAVLNELGARETSAEPTFYGSYGKHRESSIEKLGPATRQLIEGLNSAPFLDFLERVTGIEGLLPDPYLEGGGVHRIRRGGFLKIHTDFNWHRRLRVHRRLNLLLYLNSDWEEDWGGALEFWDPEVQACQKRILPIFNRMVVFSTSDESYHGHPEPLACPSGRERVSIALYYYTSQRPAAEIRFSASEMTNYKERPDETFARGKFRHQLHQAEIRRPVVRKILGVMRALKASWGKLRGK